jgi:uncharacterized membrane protein
VGGRKFAHFTSLRAFRCTVSDYQTEWLRLGLDAPAAGRKVIQDGQNVICRHCGSAIYVPSVGDQGGCNPIAVPSHMDGGDLVMDISSLTQAAKEIPQ